MSPFPTKPLPDKGYTSYNKNHQTKKTFFTSTMECEWFLSKSANLSRWLSIKVCSTLLKRSQKPTMEDARNRCRFMRCLSETFAASKDKNTSTIETPSLLNRQTLWVANHTKRKAKERIRDWRIIRYRRHNIL